MEDREIIALYNQREEQAISATRSKYGAFLYGIAMNILRQSQDAEECESDTYHNAWRHIPPDCPWGAAGVSGEDHPAAVHFPVPEDSCGKRNPEMEVLLEELEQCGSGQL